MILSYFGIAVSVNQDEIKVRYNASETEQTYARANADFENIAITISNSTQKQRIYINGTFVDELDMEANIGTAKTDSTYWYL